MLKLRDISEDTALFPWNKSTPYPAVESTIAVAIALLLGVWTGHGSAGSIAAGAAFTVGFAVFHEALSSTLLSMAMLTFGIASATLIGSLGAQWTPVVLILCVLAAFNYGLLANLDTTASWIGQQCGVYVVISSYFANGLHYAVGRTAMVLAGGALQMLLFAGFRFLHRYSHRNDPPQPPVLRQLQTRIRQLWRCLQDQFHPNTETYGYIIKLGITLGISTGVYRYLHLRNGYWAPMTALLVLKPKWANTLSRGIARLAGTMCGAAITVFLARLLPPLHHETYFILILLTAYLCFTLQGVNYALFSAVLTMYTVFLFGFGGFSERSAASLRLVNTALGGLLALLVDATAKYVGPRLLPGAPKTPAAASSSGPAAKLRTITSS